MLSTVLWRALLMSRYKYCMVLLSVAVSGYLPIAAMAQGSPPYDPAQASQQYTGQQAAPQQQQQYGGYDSGAQGAFSQQAYQQPSQQYGGAPDPSNPYGPPPNQAPTYYGYAADAQAQAQAQAAAQAQQQAQQQQQYPPQQQPYNQQGQGQQQYAQQPVYGQQAPPANSPPQSGNLAQFLDKTDQNQPKQNSQPSGPGAGSKIMSGAGTLAKVAGTLAAGYMMSRAINRQTNTMQRMAPMGMGMPMGMPMGGMGMPMGGYGMPMGGYGMPMGGYGMPMGGYGMMPGNAMMGATVMNGLNTLLNH